MKQVRRSVLLWYAPHEVYTLVTDIDAYPSFLPWCERVDVLQRDDSQATARLHVAYAGIRLALTTKNAYEPDRSVRIDLVDGPFSTLQGLWRFAPVDVASAGTATSETPSPAMACRIDFELSYAFANIVLETAISPAFDRIANTFVDSFVRRAEVVYGQR